MRRLKVQSNGQTVAVVDRKTGEPIAGVRRVCFLWDGGTPTLHVELDGVAVEVEAEADVAGADGAEEA